MWVLYPLLHSLGSELETHYEAHEFQPPDKVSAANKLYLTKKTVHI